MTEQQLPFQRHSETSKDAAGKASSRAPGDRWRVFLAIGESGSRGHSDNEVQELLGMSGSTQRPRRVELVRAGLLFDYGDRLLTQGNRMAVAWRLSLKGAGIFMHRLKYPDEALAQFNAMFKTAGTRA